MKIAVIGYSGAGKSTLAKKLGKLFRCPVLHLDRIQFEPGWKERDRETAKRMAEDFLDENENRGWIIDGNYTGFSQERRLREADLIIFMNYPRWICLWQALVRSRIYRGRTREDMGDGCIEKMDWEFVWWSLHKGRSRKKKRQYRSIAERYQEKTLVVKNRRQLRSVMIQVVERRKDRLSTGGRTI